MTAALVFAAGFFVATVTALPLLWWDRQTLVERLGEYERRDGAYLLADTRTDLDLVPLTPERGTARVEADPEPAAFVMEGVASPLLRERCESCDAPANLRLEDGSTWCHECDEIARELEGTP